MDKYKESTLLTCLFLTIPVMLEAHSKTGKFWGGFFGIITLIICVVMAYVCIIGYSENRNKPDSDNQSVGCMIFAYIAFAIFAIFILLKACS